MVRQYDLNRFLSAQDITYDMALSEIKSGKKIGHWIWFVFPQLKRLGRSFKSEYYGIDGYTEAVAYYQDIILGARLRKISRELYNNCVQTNSSIQSIMGIVDSMKVCSCMTLFDLVSPDDVFEDVLHFCFNDVRCKPTLAACTNDGIVKSITDFISSPDYETVKKDFDDVKNNYYEMIYKGKMKFEEIPLCFMADAWCLLEEFTIENNILIAYASNYHSGPPDYVGFYAKDLPTIVLETAYKILTKK